MAETYRKSKIEKFYNQVKWEINFTKEQLEKENNETHLYAKPYLEGELKAFERILRKMEEEFDLS